MCVFYGMKNLPCSCQIIRKIPSTAFLQRRNPRKKSAYDRSPCCVCKLRKSRYSCRVRAFRSKRKPRTNDISRIRILFIRFFSARSYPTHLISPSSDDNAIAEWHSQVPTMCQLYDLILSVGNQRCYSFFFPQVRFVISISYSTSYSLHFAASITNRSNEILRRKTKSTDINRSCERMQTNAVTLRDSKNKKKAK